MRQMLMYFIITILLSICISQYYVENLKYEQWHFKCAYVKNDLTLTPSIPHKRIELTSVNCTLTFTCVCKPACTHIKFKLARHTYFNCQFFSSLYPKINIIQHILIGPLAAHIPSLERSILISFNLASISSSITLHAVVILV